MKKIVRKLLVISLSVSLVLINTVPVRANGYDDFINEVVLISESVLESYESSVIARMVGRAGASTSNGAHGIAYEIMYMDKANLNNYFGILKPENHIQLSESSIDDVADLIVVNADDEVVGLIQCKDAVSTSGVRKILEQVASGKYDGAELVGTTECADAFNEAAKNLGIDVEMIDTGISHEATKEIAEKALGTSIKNIMKKVTSNSAVGAAVSGGIALIESKINGYDDATTMSNVTTSSVNGAVSAATGTVATEIVTAGFVTIGVSGAIVPVVVFVAGIVAGTIVYVALESIEEEYNTNEYLTNVYDEGMTRVADAYVDCDDAIREAANSAKEGCKKAKTIIDTGADDTVEFYANLIKR